MSNIKFPSEKDFKYKKGQKVFIDYPYRVGETETLEFEILFICTWYSEGIFYHIMNNVRSIPKIEEKELITLEELRNRKINELL